MDTRSAGLAANALSFLAVIVALLRIELPAPASVPKESLTESLKAGIRHVLESPLLSVLALLGAAGSFFSFPLITYLPVVAGNVLGTGAAGYSLLLTSDTSHQQASTAALIPGPAGQDQDLARAASSEASGAPRGAQPGQDHVQADAPVDRLNGR